MSSTKNISFANLICRFGKEKVLLDFAQDIVLPAFLNDGYVRTSGKDTNYFFHGAQLKEFGNILVQGPSVPLFVVHGRFIKDTVLKRTQVYSSDQGLIPDEEAIQSAPSAFFVVVLNNHKVIYLPETPYAPPLQAFATTVRRFIRLEHQRHIDALHQRSKSQGEPRPKKQLMLEIPPPEVEVVPLASRCSIDEFLQQYQTLTRFELQLVDTNQEIQASKVYQEMREIKARLAAQKTRVIHESNQGINTDEAGEQIHAAASTGNQNVKLVGKAADGSIVTGNNDSVKLRVPIDDVPEDPSHMTQRLLQVYEDQISRGVLIQDTVEVDLAKLEQLRDGIKQ